ncbi:hypothetical protein [Thalassospira sp.]|uniref:hypothetical protein n=1 Tax=Thalassospira sp. TaxID=1912094 RepID=UPI00311DAF32
MTETEDQKDGKLEDRPFNPWRIPITDKAKQVVEEAIKLLESYERYYKLRKRTRRPADQTVFERTVSAILCDAIYHHLTGDAGDIFITRSNQVLGRKSRYRPYALNKKLPAILDMMIAPEMAYIALEVGHQGYFGPARRSTIKSGWRALQRIEEHDLSIEDFGLADDQEVIILRSKKEDFWDEGEDIEYDDTSEKMLYRQQVRDINEWLACADLSFDEATLNEGARFVDSNDRRLRRIFTQERFDSGGRLFGGFWQRLKKNDRFSSLMIGDEFVVELDYGQMTPRIIYGMLGEEPPADDLYSVPGFANHRSGIKRVMNAMLFSTKPLTRMPKGVRQSFARDHHITDVCKAIEAAHPAISSKFYTGIGHETQFIESEILIDTLLRLKEMNIIALPVHDALIVPSSSQDRVKEVMLSTFKKHTGIDGLVTVEKRE